MKVRIISGAVAAVILVVIMCFVNTPVFAVAISVISALAVFEVLKVMKMTHPEIFIPCIIISFLSPLRVYINDGTASGIFILLIIAVLIIQLIRFKEILFAETAAALFVTVALSYAFSSLVLLRDGCGGIGEGYLANEGLYYIIIALFSAWITDTAAYFSGYFFGKRKLCPSISPKKTVEGAIGGVLGCIIVNVVTTAIFNLTMPQGEDLSIGFIIPISLVLSVIGMCGDLTASVVKRNFGVKDFGRIMPGHGGVMDRFDSVVFTAPALYAILLIIK